MKKNRRNFLKTGIVTLLLWAALALLITQTSPDSLLIIATFFFLTFWAFLLPLSVIFTNPRRGLIFTFGILGSLALKPLSLFTPTSLGAWWAIILLIEFWLSTKQYR